MFSSDIKTLVSDEFSQFFNWLSNLRIIDKFKKIPFLFLRISDICSVLTPYSADKLVPFSSFYDRKFIDCLSFIEGTDRIRF